MRGFRVGDKVRPIGNFPIHTQRVFSLDINRSEIEEGGKSIMLEIYTSGEVFTISDTDHIDDSFTLKENKRYTWKDLDFKLATNHNKGGELL